MEDILFCILLFIAGIGVGRYTCSVRRSDIIELEERIDMIERVLWEHDIDPW